MTDRVALVTGGARRIGAAIVTALHQRGLTVIIHCNQSMDEAVALADSLNALRPDSARVVQADLCDNEQVEKLASETLACWNRVDVLVNNASMYFPTPLETASQEDWDKLIGSNLRGHFFLSQALASELQARRGTIVNISDIYADRPLANHTIYNIAKSGVKAMTRTLAVELAPAVRVNAVAPGAILWGPALADESERGVPEKRKQFLQSIPVGRLGTPQEIAATVCYLALADSYMTGETIRVDGGRYLS